MRILDRLRGLSPWMGCIVVAFALAATCVTARAQAPASQPAAAPTTAPAPITPNPAGDTGAGGSLLTPNAATGWPVYTTDKTTGAVTPKTTGLTPDETVQTIVRPYYSINMTWTLVCGFLVMFMQAGFALVETGLIRGKNASHTMSMNFMVYAIGMFGFFICGFAFMCGGANGTNIGGPGQLGGVPTLDTMVSVGSAVTYNGATDHGWGIIGNTGYFLTGKGYDGAVAVWFLFMMVFMDTTATIVTGAGAERWSFKSFFVFSLFVGAFIYPVFGCWVWGGGWLAQMGYRWGLGHGACDYAGSGVVHLQGGSLAFITALMIGPRLGKYKNGKVANPIAAHNMPMVMLGSFILAFGWFGFNPGSSLSAMDGRIGIIATNTMLAGMSATMFGTMFMWWFGPTKKPDPGMMCNQLLAGLVAITAPCAFVSPCGAFIIGAVAGVLVCLSCFFFDKIRVDDPVGAISIHGVNGAWGVLAVGLFADGTYGGGYNAVWDSNVVGLFYGEHNVKQLIAQTIEVVVCVGWNVIVGGILFFITGLLVGGNRVSAKVEIAGLDIPEMGTPGYPEYIKTVLPEDISDEEVEEIKAGKKLEPAAAGMV